MAFTKITHAGIGSTGTVLLENLEVTGVGTFGGSVSVGGTLTYEDVTNVDSVGLITARNGIVVGSGITLSVDGDGFFTGVITATSYSGIDLSDVTGATGDFSIADKIIHTGDTNTALRFPAADTITAETGGSERARINSNGQLLVGTTTTPSNSNSKLRVHFDQSSSSGSAIEMSHSTNGADKAGAVLGLSIQNGGESTNAADLTFQTASSGSLGTRMTIKSDGQLLHKHNASIGLGRDFETSSTSGYGGIAINRFSADTGSGGLDFVKSRNASLGGNTIVQSGDNIGAITWRGADGTDFATPAAQIKVAVDGTPGSNDMPGRIVFYTTADGESSVTERLRITSTGKIGITEPSPSNYGIHASQSSESVYYRADSGSVDSIFGSATSLGYSIAGTTSNHPFVLFANNAEKLRITSDGDVAITTRGSVEGVSKLNVEIPARTTAFSASDGDTWHDVLIENPGSATTNAIGLCFQVTGDSYHKNAGTGIAAVKNGTASDYGADLVFITRPQSAAAQERLRIASNGYITEAFKPVKTAQDTNVQNISGERFVIDLPDTSRMYRITGSFSFNNGIYRIWGDLGSNWSDGHTPSIEGFANWWQDGAGGPTYQDVTSTQYFEVADPVDSGFEVTYDILLTTMAHNGTARPGVSGNISWTYNGVGRAWTVFSYQDTAASGTDRLTQWAWDIDIVSGTMGTGQHQYVIEQYPITQ